MNVSANQIFLIIALLFDPTQTESASEREREREREREIDAQEAATRPECISTVPAHLHFSTMG